VKKISIIIPVYNECLYIKEVLDRVLQPGLFPGMEREIIVVDDGSVDGTTEILKAYGNQLVTVHHSMINFGKGVAIRIGLKYVTGDIVVIQDADGEYNPEELQKLVQPIVEGKADVVYGSRFMGSIKGMKFKHFLANRILTWTANILYGTYITDEATAYKAFRASVIKELPLTCNRFEFCPEVTSKVLKKGYSILEVPVTYSARGIEEGKKIRWTDGIQAMWTLIRFRISN
jgi:glycosyltransferase involved in cell wall biosynthesis